MKDLIFFDVLSMLVFICLNQLCFYNTVLRVHLVYDVTKLKFLSDVRFFSLLVDFIFDRIISDICCLLQFLLVTIWLV